VVEAGGDGLTDRVQGDFGLIVGDRQEDGSGDQGGVATDLGAVAIQQCAAVGCVGPYFADGPQVCASLQGHAEGMRVRMMSASAVEPSSHNCRFSGLEASAGIRTLECGSTPVRILGLRARGRSGKPV
jgi:hypothetical protein